MPIVSMPGLRPVNMGELAAEMRREGPGGTVIRVRARAALDPYPRKAGAAAQGVSGDAGQPEPPRGPRRPGATSRAAPGTSSGRCTACRSRSRRRTTSQGR